MKLPAGEYYIGDYRYISYEKENALCWLWPADFSRDVVWQPQHSFAVEGADREAQILIKSGRLVAFPTTHLPKDNDGKPVLDMLPGEMTPDQGYMIETFSEPFDCEIRDGIICIGYLTVNAVH